MKPLNFISIQNIISTFYRETGFEEISESDAIEWAGAALEHIGCPEYCVLETMFARVNNYVCDLPANLFSILQVAKRADNTIIDAATLCSECNFPPEIMQNIELTLDDPINDPLPSYLSLIYFYFDLAQVTQPWTVVQASYSSFLNKIECAQPIDLYTDKTQVYTVRENELVFSFEEGYVAVSYYKRKLDTNGYPYIPDEISVREAILKYILYKYFSRLWYLGREGAERKMLKSEQDWHWYCRQAKNKAKRLTHDEMIDVGNFMNTLLPRDNYYKNFYRDFGRPEERAYLKNNIR